MPEQDAISEGTDTPATVHRSALAGPPPSTVEEHYSCEFKYMTSGSRAIVFPGAGGEIGG
jgi:hypothetical protein